MKLNDFDKALADYAEAIKINPKEVRYYLLRSYIYETKNDVKNSMADTDHVLKMDPNNAEAKARKDRLNKTLAMKANSAGRDPDRRAAANAQTLADPEERNDRLPPGKL